MTIGIFLASMDQTIVISCEYRQRNDVDDTLLNVFFIPAYAAIGSELKELQNTSWIATAYMLTLTSFQCVWLR